MATIIRDGFDFYGSASDLSANYWSSTGAPGTTLNLSTTTRFGTGQCVTDTGANDTLFLQQPVGSNEQTLFFAGAQFNVNTFNGVTTSGAQLRFLDGATLQLTVLFALDGAIRVYRGDTLTGTLLATFAGAYSAQVWNQWNVKVVIDNANGEVHVRKNGATTDTFAATGLDTQASANAYANIVEVHDRFVSIRWDDMWWYTGAGAVPNDFVGDVRAVQIMPNADSAIQFTQPFATIECGYPATSSTLATNGNQQITLGSFSARDGTLATMNLYFNAGATGNTKVAIYDSDGTSGAPKTLVATSNQLTNPVIGVNAYTFAAPPTLIGNHTYWVAWLTDVSSTLVTTSGATDSKYLTNQTYGSGFLSPWSAPTISGNARVRCNIPVTPTGNFSYEEELAEDGALSYVQSSTPGNVDLYANGGLTITPQSILGLSVRGFQAKDNAGARLGQVRIKSGAVTQDGASVPLSATYQNVFLLQDTDPNTGVAWTATGILNATFGPKVG